jgi:hypothetical protein
MFIPVMAGLVPAARIYKGASGRHKQILRSFPRRESRDGLRTLT